ncbi:MAG: hypothetical protein ACK54C_01910 [Betaproteobacteria bacterium]
MNDPKRESAHADEGRLETPVRPCAWAHRYSPRGLLHTLRYNQQDAEDDAAIVGGSAHAVALYDERALDEAVAAERERLCAAIKAADDKASEGDYMLDSGDCISVIRGTWTPWA